MFSSGHQLWNLDNTTLENKASMTFSSGWSFEYVPDDLVYIRGISILYIKQNDLYLSVESNGTIVLDSFIENSTSQLWLNVSYTTDGYFTIINSASRNSLLTSTSIHPLSLEGKLSTTY